MSEQFSSVAEAIRIAKSARKGALIGYLPVGFPDLDTSVEAAIAMSRSGADVIEFGVPYSDPVMDGQVIQEASVSPTSSKQCAECARSWIHQYS